MQKKWQWWAGNTRDSLTTAYGPVNVSQVILAHHCSDIRWTAFKIGSQEAVAAPWFKDQAQNYRVTYVQPYLIGSVVREIFIKDKQNNGDNLLIRYFNNFSFFVVVAFTHFNSRSLKLSSLIFSFFLPEGPCPYPNPLGLFNHHLTQPEISIKYINQNICFCSTWLSTSWRMLLIWRSIFNLTLFQLNEWSKFRMKLLSTSLKKPTMSTLIFVLLLLVNTSKSIPQMNRWIFK